MKRYALVTINRDVHDSVHTPHHMSKSVYLYHLKQSSAKYTLNISNQVSRHNKPLITAAQNLYFVQINGRKQLQLWFAKSFKLN